MDATIVFDETVSRELQQNIIWWPKRQVSINNGKIHCLQRRYIMYITHARGLVLPPLALLYQVMTNRNINTATSLEQYSVLVEKEQY